MVVVDTSIWIDHFSGRASPQAAELGRLVARREAAFSGVVLAELLRGRRAQEDRALLERKLGGATLLEMTRSAWRRAGAISGELDARGEPIAMTDIFTAALALENDCELFTRDKHFERIPGLRLYQWEETDA